MCVGECITCIELPLFGPAPCLCWSLILALLWHWSFSTVPASSVNGEAKANAEKNNPNYFLLIFFFLFKFFMLSFFFQFFAFQAVRFFFGWSLDNAWKFEFWLKKSYESFLMKTSPRRGASDNRPIGQAHSNRVEGEKTWYWKKKQQKTEKYGSNVPRIIRNARREINSRQISIRYTYTLTAHAPKKKGMENLHANS